MGILNGINKLGLVHVAAESVANSAVSEGAQRAVQEESVVVEVQEVAVLRQLRNVDAP